MNGLVVILEFALRMAVSLFFNVAYDFSYDCTMYDFFSSPYIEPFFENHFFISTFDIVY